MRTFTSMVIVAVSGTVLVVSCAPTDQHSFRAKPDLSQAADRKAVTPQTTPSGAPGATSQADQHATGTQASGGTVSSTPLEVSRTEVGQQADKFKSDLEILKAKANGQDAVKTILGVTPARLESADKTLKIEVRSILKIDSKVVEAFSTGTFTMKNDKWPLELVKFDTVKNQEGQPLALAQVDVQAACLTDDCKEIFVSVSVDKDSSYYVFVQQEKLADFKIKSLTDTSVGTLFKASDDVKADLNKAPEATPASAPTAAATPAVAAPAPAAPQATNSDPVQKVIDSALTTVSKDASQTIFGLSANQITNPDNRPITISLMMLITPKNDRKKDFYTAYAVGDIEVGADNKPVIKMTTFDNVIDFTTKAKISNKVKVEALCATEDCHSVFVTVDAHRDEPDSNQKAAFNFERTDANDVSLKMTKSTLGENFRDYKTAAKMVQP